MRWPRGIRPFEEAAERRQKMTSFYFDMNAPIRTCRALLCAAVFSSVLLTGCAVDSHGAYRLDADELTASKLYPFQTAFGNAVLRRTVDGRYQIKLYDRQAIFDVARTDGVVVDSVLTANSETYVTLRIPRPACPFVYRTLLVKQNEVDHYDIPADCSTPVSFALEDGHLLAVQQKAFNARYWKMTDTTVVSAIVPSPLPLVDVRPSRAGNAGRSESASVSQHRPPPRHKPANSGTVSANATETGTEPTGGARHLAGASVVGTPQKISTADSSNRTPVHIDLDDSH